MEKKTERAYTQFYHSGIIEAACNLEIHKDSYGMPYIYTEYEKWLVNQKYLNVLKVLGFSSPVYLFVSLLNVNGVNLLYPEQKGMSSGTILSSIIHGDKILLREKLIESFDTSPEDIFKTIFDRLSNAWGAEKSLHFDVDEKRQPQTV